MYILGFDLVRFGSWIGIKMESRIRIPIPNTALNFKGYLFQVKQLPGKYVYSPLELFCDSRQGGIETIANDYSLRNTASYVAFGEKQRQIGVAAKAGQMTNVKRTFFGFKRLLGRKFDDPQVQDELSR